jgi:hypothetical protein
MVDGRRLRKQPRRSHHPDFGQGDDMVDGGLSRGSCRKWTTLVEWRLAQPFTRGASSPAAPSAKKGWENGLVQATDRGNRGGGVEVGVVFLWVFGSAPSPTQ